MTPPYLEEEVKAALQVVLSSVEVQSSRIEDIAGQLDVLKEEVEGHDDHQVRDPDFSSC